MELFRNTAATTLNNGGSVNNSSDPVTFTVTSSTGFPASGDFRILIGTEIMKVTSVSGTSFTAARAQEGTTIATHADGSAVTHILTAGSLLQLMSDYNMVGTFANRPAAGFAGRRYQCTDTPFHYIDNGTIWEKFYGSFPIVTPDNSVFSWVNQSNAILTSTKDMVSLDLDAGASSGVCLRVKTCPTAPYTVTCGFFSMKGTPTSSFFDIIVRQTSDGRIVRFDKTLEASHFKLSLWKYNTATSYASTYVDRHSVQTDGSLVFLRVKDDNTNRMSYYSVDGVNWVLVHTVGRTDWLTADQIGIGIEGGQYTKMSLFHWKEE